MRFIQRLGGAPNTAIQAAFCMTVLLLAACDGGKPAGSVAVRADAPAFMVGTGQALHNPREVICVGGGATFCGRQVDPNVDGAIADPMLTKATAITGANGESFILATTTNIGYFLAYKTEQGGANGIFDMRLRISAATGVPAANIVVVSDHSHNGPDTIGLWGGVEESYLEITANAVVDAAVEAFESRRAARLRVAAINQNDAPVEGVRRIESSAYSVPPAADEARGNPSNEFRLLVADDAATGARILSLMNYAPHATVWNGAATDKLTGDWAAWAPQEAEAAFGGMGLAAVGSVGATDWNKVAGEAAEKMQEARERLRLLLAAADAALEPVSGDTVQVDTRFIRETITQPVLLANYKPRSPTNQPGLPSEHFDVRIDRSILPPFLTGTVFGTYISAIRIGDLFFSTFPGEPFGELEYVIRGEQRVAGAQAYFLLGAANDFFGYMVHSRETYAQIFEGGAAWLAGCPERDLANEIGLPKEQGCADHWTLMVSPNIGPHIVCTLQDGADALGFSTAGRDPECAALTALDGMATPDDLPSVLNESLEQRAARERKKLPALAELCPNTAAPPSLCAALQRAR